MVLNETYMLSNGIQIPKIGLGTWFIEGAAATQAIVDAVNLGYRHIDSAEAYGNEREIGEGIKKCGVRREELFVTTKLHAEIKNYADAKKAIEKSLQDLDCGYIDLMLIHAAEPWADFRGGDYSEGNAEAWRALEEAYGEGKLKAIGVANFEVKDLEALSKTATVLPQVNQVLCHISNTPFELIDYCKKNNILVEAYSPIAHGAIVSNEQIGEIAKKYNVSIPQLCIRYCLQLGLLPLPKAANKDHMATNANVDFSIADEDIAKLARFEKIKDYGQFNYFPCFGKNI